MYLRYTYAMDFIASLPLLQIHLTAVFTTLAIVVVADAHGLLWILGKLQTLPQKKMELLHKATWVGLITIMIAGVSMFIGYPEYLLSLPAFRFKLLFIAALLVNAFFIGKHLTASSEAPFASLSPKQRSALLTSGAVSSASWIGAFVSAQFLS
jgi:hypothetical protein